MSSYYSSACAGCHGATPTTCNGCHRHRGTVTGTLPKSTFAPGEAMVVTVSAGQRSGWWHAAVMDEANNVVGAVSVTATGAATVSATAPTATGPHSWKVAWYGNKYTETPAAGTWIDDSGNAGHGYFTAPLPSFTVAATPVPTPAAGLSPTTLALGTVTTGQTAAQAATVSNTGTADLVVSAAVPCASTNPASLTLSPAGGFTVAAGATATLTVSFAPAAAGAATACWSLATNDPANPALQLTATGTGADVVPPPQTCTGCHTIPPSTGQHAAHATEGCGTCHGAGYSSTTVAAGTHANGTVDLASGAGWDRATSSCANACHGTRSWGTAPPPPTQSCTTCHAVPPSSGKHSTHASESCGACHGDGYSSTTVVAATHQDGKVTFGASAGWSATSRSCANSCHGSKSWGGTPTGACNSCHAMPPTSGRHAKHRSENVACSSCHGSGYSTTKVNATTHNNGTVNLTAAVRWNATRRSCANSCHGSESWGGSGGTPPPSTGCTSCHSIPPSTGQHAKHTSKRIGCGSCHGSGYSSSTVNASTHRNGKVNLSSRIGFRASRRTCSNSCHGSESWLGSSGGGDDHEEDDFVVAADGEDGAGKAASGCNSAGSSLPLLGLVGVSLLGLRRRRAR